ncbi:hypothetical protein V496_00047 [Pseudogymnoascus sp. VKM F-4515 (FW-2607)]|nr:hypothetical protein V496_00047 [Pseudogymnoascus sp. VKM F-4515 (FW-2607)]
MDDILARLDSYLSRDTRQNTDHTANTSFPITSSGNTHSTGADESREWSHEENTPTRETTAWRTLPALTSNRANVEACALPPPSLYPSQRASTVRYNGGHSQSWHVHEQLPHGLNQASDLGAPIPSVRLLNTLENYIQQAHVRASKRKRVGDGPPTLNTSFLRNTSVDTHNTGADGSHEKSIEENTQAPKPHSSLLPPTAWRTLPTLTSNRANAEACALPPPSLYPSQRASTVRYNGGHSQSWHVHEQLPNGLNPASDSAASIPSARLLDSLGNYIQQTHVRASKRKRVAAVSQDTALSESDMSAWNGRSVENQTGTNTQT